MYDARSKAFMLFGSNFKAYKKIYKMNESFKKITLEILRLRNLLRPQDSYLMIRDIAL